MTWAHTDRAERAEVESGEEDVLDRCRSSGNCDRGRRVDPERRNRKSQPANQRHDRFGLADRREGRLSAEVRQAVEFGTGM